MQVPGSPVIELDSLRCTGLAAGGGCARYDVSLVELIAQPTQYDGRPVRVVGFAHFEFEGNGLYLHREDYAQSISHNSVWLEPPGGEVAAAQRANDRYVIVEGTFDARNRGHLSMRSGAIVRVTRLDPWSRSRSPGGETPKRP